MPKKVTRGQECFLRLIPASVVFGRHFRFSYSLSLFDEMLLSFSPILVISIFESFRDRKSVV